MPTEGGQNLPSDPGPRYFIGFVGQDGNLYAPRGGLLGLQGWIGFLNTIPMLAASGTTTYAQWQAKALGDNVDGSGVAAASIWVWDVGTGTYVRLRSSAGALQTVPVKGNKTISPTVSVTTAAIQLLAANGSRKVAYITNAGSAVIWLGKDNTITVDNGVPLNPGDRLIDGDTIDAWWAIAESGTNSIAVMEVA